MGYNIIETVSFATPRWIDIGKFRPWVIPLTRHPWLRQIFLSEDVQVPSSLAESGRSRCCVSNFKHYHDQLLHLCGRGEALSRAGSSGYGADPRAEKEAVAGVRSSFQKPEARSHNFHLTRIPKNLTSSCENSKILFDKSHFQPGISIYRDENNFKTRHLSNILSILRKQLRL